VQIIRNSTNLGFGAANNIGAKCAKGKYLLFANADVIVRANPAPEMINALQTGDGVGIVGCQLYNEDGTVQPSFFRFPNIWLRFLQLSSVKSFVLSVVAHAGLRRAAETSNGFVSGAFFMIERKLFLEIGGFDERFFMYIEDADLGYRVHCRGMRTVILQSSRIVHLGRNYEDDRNPFVCLHMNVGILLFHIKHHHGWRHVALVCLSIPFYLIKMMTLTGKTHIEIRRVYKTLLKVYIRSLLTEFEMTTNVRA
jgi:GT2 family glycosyltransferase